MPGPFAIAAVTAVLKDLLNDGLLNRDLSALGNVTVTNLPPDRIGVTNADERSQLNVFLYQVSPNQGWRNQALPSRSRTGERLTNPPLAIDLRYLITAYGREEFHAEALLGYAMQLLHEYPVLTRAMINQTLKPSLPPGVTLPPGLSMLATSDLAEQAELIKITPAHLDAEEMSRLWSAMQAKYRPTAVYHVSVVLIEADKAQKSPLPVLQQGDQGRGPSAQASVVPPFPALEQVLIPGNQTQALLGEVITVTGHHLAGETALTADVTVVVRLSSPRRPAPLEIVVPPVARSEKQIAFTVPNTPSSLPAGVYSLAALVTPLAAPDDARTSNELPFLIAPRITSGLGAPIARTGVDPITGLGTAVVVISCSPEVLPDQRVTMVLGAKEALAEPHPGATANLTFTFPALASGEYWVRLRVDGAESRLVDRSLPETPIFDPSQKIELT